MAAQVPQASTPDTWLLLASVLVEHQGLYPPLVVQAVWETPLNLNGKTQSALPPGPTALQSVDLEQKVRKTGLKWLRYPEPDPDEQFAGQYPQAPFMWLLFSSVFVEHQGLSPSMVVQLVWETPRNLKGKTQAEPIAAPPMVIQLPLLWIIGYCHIMIISLH